MNESQQKVNSDQKLDEQAITEKIIEIAAKTSRIDKNKITPDSHFVDDLQADSLDQVELMMEIEIAFGCEIPDNDASKIATIKDAVKYVSNIIKIPVGN